MEVAGDVGWLLARPDNAEMLAKGLLSALTGTALNDVGRIMRKRNLKVLYNGSCL